MSLIRYEINSLNNNLVCYDYHVEFGGGLSLEDVRELSLKDNETKLKYFIIQELYKLKVSKMNIDIDLINIVYDNSKMMKPIKYITVPVSIKNFFDVDLKIDIEQTEDYMLSPATMFETQLLNIVQTIKNKENELKDKINQEIVSKYEDLLIAYDVETMR
ncbi:hypothetical protein HMPREF2862_10785 [Staphylococcus sp. HMSC065C09]|uniref:hypothetical protein n=3 Tax=unclassified Staphylococcus TaxID=91994 RepID=UPI0008A1F119|nr:hypothetical protein [Staphylococcus sp. HMSC065C09]OFS52755.1 hypothetical protein HMPREF2862_10785 [Staphylococcus sp. HMSC065C09]